MNVMLFKQYEQIFFCTVLWKLSNSGSLVQILKCHRTCVFFSKRSNFTFYRQLFKRSFLLQKAVTKMLIKCQTKERSTFADNGVSRLSEIMSSGWTGMYKQCQVCQKEIENDVCTGQAGQKKRSSHHGWLCRGKSWREITSDTYT